MKFLSALVCIGLLIPCATAEPLIVTTRMNKDSDDFRTSDQFQAAGMKFYDSNLNEIGQQELFKRILRKPKLLVYIHGYDNSTEALRDSCIQIEKWDPNLQVIGFGWPAKGVSKGNSILAALNGNYSAHREQVENSGRLLRDLVNNQLGEHQIYIFAHSMGSRAVIKALQLKDPIRLNGLTLVAAEQDVLGLPEAFGLPVHNVYFSGEKHDNTTVVDLVLKTAQEVVNDTYSQRPRLGTTPGDARFFVPFPMTKESIDLEDRDKAPLVGHLYHCYQFSPRARNAVKACLDNPFPLTGGSLVIRNVASGGLLEIPGSGETKETMPVRQYQANELSNAFGDGVNQKVWARNHQRWDIQPVTSVTLGSACEFTLKNEKGRYWLQCNDKGELVQATSPSDLKRMRWYIKPSGTHFMIQNVESTLFLQGSESKESLEKLAQKGFGSDLKLAKANAQDSSQLWDVVWASYDGK